MVTYCVSKESCQNQNQHGMLQGFNEEISSKSPLQPVHIPHHCLRGEQLTTTRTSRAGQEGSRPHSYPSNSELNLCRFKHQNSHFILGIQLLEELGSLKNHIYFVKYYIEQCSQIRHIFAEMPFIAVYFYMAYR